MRIVVTGGAGFIGSHLCEKLIALGHMIVCIDNFVSGNDQNIKKLRQNKLFHLINHDICLPFTEDVGKIDQIYHLASPACPMDFKEIPLQTIWTNAAGTKNMLELAAKKMAALLLASDGMVESCIDHLGPESCYVEGKRFAETMAINYYRNFRFPLKIARIWPTYGPRIRKYSGAIVADLIQNALSGEPLRIPEDDSRRVYLCYVDDMVNGLIKLMENIDFSGPVNLGSQSPVTALTLAKKIINTTGSKSIITHTEYGQYGFAAYFDPTVAFEKPGFGPIINLDEGLKKTIEYFYE